jgi:hypothetical protein
MEEESNTARVGKIKKNAFLVRKSKDETAVGGTHA